MNRFKLKILGTIIAFFLAFILHNLYKYIPNIITSIIAPVNESIWEHMKLLFTSILIAGVIQKLIVINKKLDIKNVCISNFTGAITSIPVFLIIYIPIYNLIGKDFKITIIVMFIAILIGECISYLIMNKKDLKMENHAIIFIIIIYITFFILTIYPPHNSIFIDPTTKTYGINNS